MDSNDIKAIILSYIQRYLLPLFIVFYVILAVHAATATIHNLGYGLFRSPYGTHPESVIVYRVLVPDLAHAIYSLIPYDAAQSLTSVLVHMRDSNFGQNVLFLNSDHVPYYPFFLSDNALVETAANVLVVFFFILAFIWMMYVLTAALFPDSRIYALLAPLIALFVIPAFNAMYVYDYSELFFSCACFYLLFRQRWRTYLLCLTVATFNKETTLFVIFFYAMWFAGRLPWKQYITLGVLQAAIYIAVTRGIIFYYADVPSIHFPVGILRTIAFYYFYDYYKFVCLIVAVMLVTYRWPEKPAFLRGGAVWMFSANLVAFFVVCNPGEYRDLYWSMPILIILATHTLVRMADVARLPIFQRQPSRRMKMTVDVQ